MPPAELLARDPAKYAKQNSYYAAVAKLKGLEMKFATVTFNRGVATEKNLDTQLTKDALVGAALGSFDTAIIVSNDGDFVSVVDGIKELGRKVEVAHFKNKFSMDLKRSADITRRLRPSFFKYIGDTQQTLIKPQPDSRAS